MAVDAKKLFGCPVCGFRVTGKEDACPRCGTKFDSKTLFECPFCGEHVSLTARSCPSCHIKFDELYANVRSRVSEESIDELLMEIIELEAKEVRKEDKRLSCPRCSWMLDGSEEKCPKCGVGFLADDVSYQCPVCAATVTAEAESCSECGSSFIEDEELEALVHGGQPATAEEAKAQAPEMAKPAAAREEAPAAEPPAGAEKKKTRTLKAKK